MEMILLLILGVPTVVAIWLIVRSVQMRQQLNELSLRLDELQLEVVSLKHPKSEAAKPSPAPAADILVARLQRPPENVAAQPTAPVPVAPAPKPPVPIIPLEKPNIPAPVSFQTKPVEKPVAVPQAARPLVPPVSIPSAPRQPLPEPAAPQGSFEMRLGTFWLVRVGIVMLLTGLVFFGNFAYQNFIGKLGPGGKISLLYFVSAALMGAGLWWQRRAEKETLRNYAQVLFAGGLAAVYFTTYAAHHITQLCVIPSPTLDGFLLLAWAGFIAWIADRKKSEVLAMFAVGLAYYTAVITDVGPFTLYSNLLLTAVGLFFLVRHRWVGLSIASLLATYASYAFWRFYHGGDWRWAEPGEGLWFGAGFLFCYWVLFTGSAFLSKSSKLTGARRASFITLNNGALFSLFLLTMVQLHSHGFWKFALFYGIALLGLSLLARRFLATERLVANTYLTQGLLLVTLGLVSKFSGLHLALVLGFESVVLLTLGTLEKSRVQIVASYIAGALAVIWVWVGLHEGEPSSAWSGTALGAFLLVNALWSHRTRKHPAGILFRPEPGYFVLLALAAWFTTTWFHTSPDSFPLVLALEAVGFTFSIYLLGLAEIPLAGQSFLLYAQFYWIYNSLSVNTPGHWWPPALILTITLGLSHWWQRQKTLVINPLLATFWQGLYALALLAVVYLWVHPLVSVPVWLALTSLLALAVTAYGVATRAWLLSAFGQLFLLVSGLQFFLQLWDNQPDWYYPLAPVLALGLLSFATLRWFAGNTDSASKVRAPLLLVAQAYRWIALAMAVRWVFVYIPEPERIWVFMGLGLLVFAFAGWRKNREALIFGAALTMVGVMLIWSPFAVDQLVYWPNLLGLLGLLAQQQIARRLPRCYPMESSFHTATIIIGGSSLWWFMSRAVLHAGGGFYLTATWAGLALVMFVGGIFLRERIYRWTGLGILAAALGRVVLFDVWKQETIFRVLTFMALGIVLLVLGYIYNKYQEQIRRWL